MSDTKDRIQRAIDRQKRLFQQFDANLKLEPDNLDLRRAREEALDECVRLIELLRELNESQHSQTDGSSPTPH